MYVFSPCWYYSEGWITSEIVIMAQFLGPEIVQKLQFLGPEMVKMVQQLFWGQKLTLWTSESISSVDMYTLSDQIHIL